ncbi:TlpA family protein disulfide reductase [Sediminitomix flava]|uniref:Thiol-disulfide isomerase/thioredoxin n=1 Tax=Sediminitomix flava TaxID=379075 RepID=A0A315ZIE1_SEDFL|nr:TlpA disulfide reductase family protein [Sediminitomix flava]PWJ44484.1 thiol-disulfide isomerase/thioredoxin [Sediminitomix flava]
MEKKKKGKKDWKRELIEGGIWIILIGGLYFSGYHTEVIGIFQRLVLKTGILNAEASSENVAEASYDLNLLDLEGNISSLEEFRGKTILINVWATWCPPCVAEMPELQALYDDIHSEEIIFVMLSVDQDLEKLKKFINRKAYDFPIYRLAGPRPKVFESNVVPTTFVVSPQGQIVFRKEGIANYNTASFKEFITQLNSK